MSRYFQFAPVVFLIFACVGTGAAPAELSATPQAVSWPGDSWEESTPAKEGLDAQVIAKLDAEIREGKHSYVDSMLIARNGRIVFDARYPRDYKAINAELVSGEPGPYNYMDVDWHPYYHGSDLHTMQSTTKSVTSALVGIAISRGEFSGVNATLGALLPERNIEDAAIAAITLENVLTMRSGFEWIELQASYWDTNNDALRVEAEDDWVAYLLDKPMVAEQGVLFNYNSINTQLLAEIISTATGRPLQDYAEEVLFRPLGIERYFWKTAPEGFNDGLGGLYLAPRDLARFALLYLNQGEWNGRQVIPAAWVEQSIRLHVQDTNPKDPNDNSGYGYQWWIFSQGNGGEPAMYGTWGWGGQYALVVPSLQMIAVLTGWAVYEGQESEYVHKIFYDRIVMPMVKAQVIR